MEPPQFKVFSGSPGQSREAASPPISDNGSPLLPVSVRDLVPLLVDAYQTDRTWLKDFGREHIHVSADLYEILLAYQQLRRCGAA